MMSPSLACRIVLTSLTTLCLVTSVPERWASPRMSEMLETVRPADTATKSARPLSEFLKRTPPCIPVKWVRTCLLSLSPGSCISMWAVPGLSRSLLFTSAFVSATKMTRLSDSAMEGEVIQFRKSTSRCLSTSASLSYSPAGKRDPAYCMMTQNGFGFFPEAFLLKNLSVIA